MTSHSARLVRLLPREHTGCHFLVRWGYPVPAAVSLMSDAGVPIENIARLVGHSGTTTTETVYRKQIRPVVLGGAEVMDSLFPARDIDD
jgi:hypothetical protein